MDRDHDLAPRLMAFFRERGVLLRPLGNTVYVMPPYCVTDEQLEAAATRASTSGPA